MHPNEINKMKILKFLKEYGTAISIMLAFVTAIFYIGKWTQKIESDREIDKCNFEAQQLRDSLKRIP